MNLIDILLESIDPFKMVNQEVDKIFRNNPPDSFDEITHMVKLICLKHKVEFKDYLIWLSKNRPKLNERK